MSVGLLVEEEEHIYRGMNDIAYPTKKVMKIKSSIVSIIITKHFPGDVHMKELMGKGLL